MTGKYYIIFTETHFTKYDLTDLNNSMHTHINLMHACVNVQYFYTINFPNCNTTAVIIRNKGRSISL